jgi:hypothetical protein
MITPPLSQYFNLRNFATIASAQGSECGRGSSHRRSSIPSHRSGASSWGSGARAHAQKRVPWPPRANWNSWSIQDFIDLGQLRSVRVPIEQTLFCAVDLAPASDGPLAVMA